MPTQPPTPQPPTSETPQTPTLHLQSNNILGGDSGDLTEAGRQYVILLNKFVKRVRERIGNMGGWVSPSFFSPYYC